MPDRKLKRDKKVNNTYIDYETEVDPYEDMDIDGLIDYEDYVPPQQEKQIVPKPPTYEESFEDVLEGNSQIYMNPDIVLPHEEEPQKYDDGIPDYAIDDEDDCEDDHAIDNYKDNDGEPNKILDDIGIENYESVEKVLNQPVMTPQRTTTYLNKIIKKANLRRIN